MFAEGPVSKLLPYFLGHRLVFFFSNAQAPAYPPGLAYRRLKVERIKQSNIKFTVFSSLSPGLFFFSVHLNYCSIVAET